MGQVYATASQLGSLGGVSVEAQFFGVRPSSGDTVAVRYSQGVVEWMRVHPWHSSMSEINIQVCEPHGCRNICLKHLSSYKMVLLLSTTSPYKLSWHDLLRIYSPFLCFITVSWAYKMPSKKQTRWSHRISWPIKILTKWTLQKPTTLPSWVFSYKMLRWWGLLEIQNAPL